MNVLAIQQFLNSHGAALAEDGKGGPATRTAILEVFRNVRAPGMTWPELKAVAERLGGSPAQVAAVARVESAGGGWDLAGRLKCLWERHWMFRRVQFAVPLLSSPKPGGYTVDADRNGINDSWEKLADAACRWGVVAFECASFGKFQIMGGHWQALGYSSPLDFVWRLSRDEAAHYDALARYIEVNRLGPAFRQIDTNPDNCRAFAKGYNGAAYARLGYHTKIADAMRREAA